MYSNISIVEKHTPVEFATAFSIIAFLPRIKFIFITLNDYCFCLTNEEGDGALIAILNVK